MLSLEACRKLLGPNCDGPDQEIERLRDQLYQLARSILDLMEPEQSESQPERHSPAAAVIRLLPQNERERLEERAAFLEFEGGRDRTVAERSVLAQAALTGGDS